MTPERYAAIAVRVALAEDADMSLDEAEKFLLHPEDAEPYRDLETFADASFANHETTFNLSDVRILYMSLLKQWIEAGRPNVKDINNPIRPLGNPQIIAELTSYGLTYLPQGTKNSDAKKLSKLPPLPNPKKSDLRSLGKLPQRST